MSLNITSCTFFFSFDGMWWTKQVLIGPVSENYPSECQTFARNDLRLQSKLPAKNLNTREETLTQFLPEKRFIHLHVKSFQRWMGWRRGNSRWSDGGFFFSFFFLSILLLGEGLWSPPPRLPPASNRGSLCLLGWRVSAAEDTPSTLQLVWLWPWEVLQCTAGGAAVTPPAPPLLLLTLEGCCEEEDTGRKLKISIIDRLGTASDPVN